MACVDLGQIVAKQSWTGRSSALGSTTIYTPSASGLFRVSAYLEVASGSITSVNAFLAYTDDHHTPNATYYGLGSLVSGDYNNSGTVQAYAFRAAASAAISVSTNYSGTGSYDFYVVLEQLW
jgi:hypothetical protein